MTINNGHKTAGAEDAVTLHHIYETGSDLLLKKPVYILTLEIALHLYILTGLLCKILDIFLRGWLGSRRCGRGLG